MARVFIADKADYVSEQVKMFLLKNRDLIPLLDKYGWYVPAELRRFAAPAPEGRRPELVEGRGAR